MLWVVDLILGGSAAAGNWCHSVACRWLLFTCHLAPPATAAAAAVPVADADAPMAMPRLRLLLKLKPSCHIRRCCEASMLWNFASASAVCSLFPVCRLQSEAVAVVIAARSVSITMVVFVVCFFRTQFCQAPHCLPAASETSSIHRPLRIPSALNSASVWVQRGGKQA